MKKLTADQRAVSYLIQNSLGDIMLTNKGEEKCYASDAMTNFASQEVAAEKQRWVEKIQKEIDDLEQYVNAPYDHTDIIACYLIEYHKAKIDVLKKLLEGEK
jgi:hypothetical protein